MQNSTRVIKTPTATSLTSRFSSHNSRQFSSVTYATKRALITGGNTGIGYEAALALMSEGNEVVIACRDESRASKAVERLTSAAGEKAKQGGREAGAASYIILDLSDLSSVSQAATKLLDAPSFDIILNNAGIMAPPERLQSAQGHELQFAVNHLGHFLLTTTLLPTLIRKTSPTRIINVSSSAHLFGSIDFDDLEGKKPAPYSAWAAYGASKLANILFSYELVRRLGPASNLTVNALHPGVVATELSRYILPSGTSSWILKPAEVVASMFLKTPAQGAATSIYLSSSPEAERVTGKYYVDCKAVTSSKASYNVQVAQRLYELSDNLCKGYTLMKSNTL